MPNLGFTIKQDKELTRDFKKWVLVRKSLGLQSFGMNMVELPSGDSIPEHDEVSRDQEEVFYIVKCTATMVINGVEYAAPEGTFIRLDVEPKRFVKNKSESLVIFLIISAPRTSGYEPLDWA